MRIAATMRLQARSITRCRQKTGLGAPSRSRLHFGLRRKLTGMRLRPPLPNTHPRGGDFAGTCAHRHAVHARGPLTGNPKGPATVNLTGPDQSVTS